MSDADKIQEAEESIQKISSELKSMKNATDLLQDAEKKTDAVLNRAEQILQATQELTGKCGEGVKTLSDFNRHFGRLINHIQIAARESRTRQYITMGFVIFSLVVALSTLSILIILL